MERQAVHPDAADVDHRPSPSNEAGRKCLSKHQRSEDVDFVHVKKLLGISVEQRSQSLYRGLLIISFLVSLG